MNTQVQLLPLGTRLRHCGLGLLPLAVQGLPLLGLGIEACCGLGEDGGHLKDGGKRKTIAGGMAHDVRN